MRNKVDNVKQNHPKHDPNHGPDATSGDVLEVIHAVMHRVRSRQHEAMRADGNELTPLEARVLGFFARHPGATQRDLAEHSGRDKGQLTRLVQGLRERGLLDAQADALDRRITRLQPSAAARQQHDAAQRVRTQLGAMAQAGLSEAERQMLRALLQRVHDNLAPGA